MAERSAGLLVFRRTEAGPAFLLAHPGGPYWSRKDLGAWTIPKGLIDADEETLAAALREFEEETGQGVDGDFVALTPLRQKSRKLIFCWMVEADPALEAFRSNTFELEWPPRSGRRQTFPEIDRVGWFTADEALEKIHPGQAGFIHEALERLAGSPGPDPSAQSP